MSVYSESDLMLIASSLLATCTMLQDGRAKTTEGPERVQQYFDLMERVKNDLQATMVNRELTAAAKAKGEVPKCSH